MTTPRKLVVDRESLAEAAEVLAAGGVVACGTDTVFGLHADARQEAAVARVRALKGDEEARPFVILCDGSSAVLERLAPSRSRMARSLAGRYWPGPLTIVMSGAADGSSPGAPSWVCSTSGGVAIRVPDSGAVTRVVTTFRWPVISTSANRAGCPTADTADDVIEVFGAEVDLVLDGASRRAEERQSAVSTRASTVVDATGLTLAVLRQGDLQIEAGFNCE